MNILCYIFLWHYVETFFLYRGVVAGSWWIFLLGGLKDTPASLPVSVSGRRWLRRSNYALDAKILIAKVTVRARLTGGGGWKSVRVRSSDDYTLATGAADRQSELSWAAAVAASCVRIQAEVLGPRPSVHEYE